MLRGNTGDFLLSNSCWYGKLTFDNLCRTIVAFGDSWTSNGGKLWATSLHRSHSDDVSVLYS